jgi:hypothetical protein
VSLLGVHLSLAIGPVVPAPAPPLLLESIDRVEVVHDDEGPSGFQMVFRAGRGPADVVDHPLLQSPLLTPGARVIMVLTIGAAPAVLFDGLITEQQLALAATPGDTVLAVTGEDVTFAMDREERSVEHVGLSEAAIAFVIITSYTPRFGLVPEVVPPPVAEVPLPIDWVPVQQATDLGYLRQLAERYDYVFTVTPGPAPGVNQAYWGPLPRLGVPQRALSVGVGPDSNVRRLTAELRAGEVTRVEGTVQDRLSNQPLPVRSLPVSLRPPLATGPALGNGTVARTTAYRARGAPTVVRAMAEAQAQQDRSTDVLRLEGELDAVRYGGLLQPRALVGLRGAGLSHDGLYYVERVAHTLVPSGVRAEASFTTRFSLRREGPGSTVPVVLP